VYQFLTALLYQFTTARDTPLENLRKLQAGIETLVAWAEERAAGQSAN
jgi:hypothetical protein